MARRRTARKVPEWLPAGRPGQKRAGLRPWQPAGIDRLKPKEDWSDVRYIVVDELQEGIAGLVVSPWPVVDGRGRLVFGDEEASMRVAVPSATLLALLEQERVPVVQKTVDDATLQQLQVRELRIGDTFAARVAHDPGEPGGGGPAGEQPEDPGDWLIAPVLDITDEAYDAARTQMHAALGGFLDESIVDAYAEERGGALREGGEA
jgi:hypothetical protein